MKRLMQIINKVRFLLPGQNVDFSTEEFQTFYQHSLKESLRRDVFIIGWTGIILCASGIILDHVLYPDYTDYFLFLRACTWSITLLAFALVKINPSHTKTRVIALGWFYVYALHIHFMVFVTEGFYSPYYFGAALVFGAGGLMPLKLLDIALGGIFIASAYVLACIGNYLWIHIPSTNESPFSLAFIHGFAMWTFVVLFTLSSYTANRNRKFDALLRLKLEKSRQELEELNRLKSDFFANISHELRTPLTLIIPPLDSLKEQVPPRNQEQIEMIRSNSQRLLSLIDNLLDLIRLESNNLQVESKELSLNAMLDGLVGSIRPTAIRHHLKITYNDSEEILIVNGEHEKLETVFLNLLYNAIKFTLDEGSIDVSLKKQNTTALISVKDSGIGIPEEDLPYIFDRFWKKDVGRQNKGTGIGLSLVKEIVEKHQGQVSVESSPNKGSTFTIELPIQETRVREKKSTLSPPVLPLSKEPFFAQAPQIHFNENADTPSILLIEDEPDVMHYLSTEFSEYTLYQASDGETGVKLGLKHQPNLVITDIMLPKLDGISVCRKLRDTKVDFPSNILVLTARVDDKTRMECLQAGADDFLTKPFSMVELKTRVKNMIHRSLLKRSLHQKNLELKKSLNDLETAQQQAIQSARLSAVGNLAAGIMHEIKNPLNTIASAIACLKNEIKAHSDALEISEDIEEELERIDRIILELGDFAYGETNHFEKLSLSELWPSVESILQLSEHKDISLKVALCESRLLANKKQMILLLTNLVQNAIDATENNTSPNLPRNISISSHKEQDHYHLIVEDNGHGFTNSEIESLFDPYYTPRHASTIQGLGLSICHTIIQQHKGQISVKSQTNISTSIHVTFPL